TFVRILANDCLAKLPPITFFRDLVVEESGKRTDAFRIGDTTLQPLVDVARVLALASGAGLSLSTRQRFQEAARGMPRRESIFAEAAETTRVVLFHQARAGLRMGTTGDEIPLSILSRHDRQVLKTGFQSIFRLLELATVDNWLERL